jgi:cytoplasmic iron level regulating protein YaaA (DUF328/UPF0246 family)
VLILLPPSEGKAAALTGPPLSVEALSFPALRPTRERMLDRLVRISGQRNALAVLGLPPGLAAQAERNTHLREAPAQAAERVYTGVLYEALGLKTLATEARVRAASSLLIFSGLFGVLRPDDAIPAYRLSMDVALPRMGAVSSVWRRVLGPVVETAAGDGPIVDCRSSTYAAAWKPPRALADRVMHVRVFQETAGGRTIVSHMAKKTRGEVARRLLQVPLAPRGVADVLEALEPEFRVEATPPASPGGSFSLDVIVGT